MAVTADNRLSYAIAWLNGSNDGASSEAFGDVDLNDDKEWAARVFAHPFAESDRFALRGLGVGLAGTYTDQVGTAAQPLLPTFRTPAQATFSATGGCDRGAGRWRTHANCSAALLLSR